MFPVASSATSLISSTYSPVTETTPPVADGSAASDSAVETYVASFVDESKVASTNRQPTENSMILATPPKRAKLTTIEIFAPRAKSTYAPATTNAICANSGTITTSAAAASKVVGVQPSAFDENLGRSTLPEVLSGRGKPSCPQIEAPVMRPQPPTTTSSMPAALSRFKGSANVGGSSNITTIPQICLNPPTPCDIYTGIGGTGNGTNFRGDAGSNDGGNDDGNSGVKVENIIASSQQRNSTAFYGAVTSVHQNPVSAMQNTTSTMQNTTSIIQNPVPIMQNPSPTHRIPIQQKPAQVLQKPAPINSVHTNIFEKFSNPVSPIGGAMGGVSSSHVVLQRGQVASSPRHFFSSPQSSPGRTSAAAVAYPASSQAAYMQQVAPTPTSRLAAQTSVRFPATPAAPVTSVPPPPPVVGRYPAVPYGQRRENAVVQNYVPDTAASARTEPSYYSSYLGTPSGSVENLQVSCVRICGF